MSDKSVDRAPQTVDPAAAGVVSGPVLRDFPNSPPGRSGWPWTDAGRRILDTATNGSQWPRISIVTPSFNQGVFLEETIRSVLLQGYPNLEYIIMDGGSTDSSVEIIGKYEGWLTHWASEPDRGQSDAINRGWARTSGDWLAWINSDDAYRPGALISAARAIRRNPDAGLIYGLTAVRAADGTSLDRCNGRPFCREEFLWGRNPVAQPSAFIRRDVLGDGDPIDESLHYAMDVDLWVRLAARADVLFVDEIWSDFRYYPESKSGQGRHSFHADIHRILEGAFDLDLFPSALAEQRRVALARSHLRLALDHYSRSDDREARREALLAAKMDPSLLWQAEWSGRLLRCLIGSRLIGKVKRLGRRYPPMESVGEKSPERPDR